MYISFRVVVDGLGDWLLLSLFTLSICLLLKFCVSPVAGHGQSIGERGRAKRVGSRCFRVRVDRASNQSRNVRSRRRSKDVDPSDSEGNVDGRQCCRERQFQTLPNTESGSDSEEMRWVMKNFYSAMGEEEDHNISCYSRS